MKTLVVFYSLGGYTKYISEILAKELEADILELKTKNVYPQSGFKKFFFGGKSVIFKEEPELTNEKIDLKPYENIIIGTPVWAGKYAAPFNTFIKQYSFEGKNVAVFACHIGGGADKCLRLIKKALKNNHFIGQTDFVNPLMKNKEKNLRKAINWARSLTF
ncbi:flavodoxin [Anaerocolumna sedimenticola]|uniref:Flavodoxin n=1 Tax=Anaerocolumna sedimenticola TaxID=2696063 RepID=A0A6P1TSG3_9FIRM|nr:flavodoxin [Anaerocolumna sedimenticola]QHQ62435.1 flavodoxin [Anaerocolumna sedimenticola]